MHWVVQYPILYRSCRLHIIDYTTPSHTLCKCQGNVKEQTWKDLIKLKNFNVRFGRTATPSIEESKMQLVTSFWCSWISDTLLGDHQRILIYYYYLWSTQTQSMRSRRQRRHKETTLEDLIAAKLAGIVSYSRAQCSIIAVVQFPIGQFPIDYLPPNQCIGCQQRRQKCSSATLFVSNWTVSSIRLFASHCQFCSRRMRKTYFPFANIIECEESK